MYVCQSASLTYHSRSGLRRLQLLLVKVREIPRPLAVSLTSHSLRDQRGCLAVLVMVEEVRSRLSVCLTNHSHSGLSSH